MKLIIMVQTVELITKGDPQFKLFKPTRVDETKTGIKYLVYE